MVAEFSHLQHPVGLLGGAHVPRAAAFNLLGFVVPGVLVAVAATGLRGRLADSPWSARIGTQALLLSSVAFAMQGLLPLDGRDLDGAGSRLHAASWTAWWLAFAVAAAGMGWGLRAGRQARMGTAFAACAVATLAFALLGPLVLPAGLAQRLAFAGWFLAPWLAGRQP